MKGPKCHIMACERMVRHLLPAMRAEVAFRLVHQKGLSQSDAARKMGMSRAAVSQYLSRKRGDGALEISPDMDALIDRWADAVRGDGTLVTLCELCQCAMQFVREEGDEASPGFTSSSSRNGRV
ncbi:MAG: helix-turn-helix domain-containing protein [Methanolinea sp.]|nr:helix-turn-helix domain-containing protein [Methanolinea sp.]